MKTYSTSYIIVGAKDYKNYDSGRIEYLASFMIVEVKVYLASSMTVEVKTYLTSSMIVEVKASPTRI